jgi:hypothetical protein
MGEEVMKDVKEIVEASDVIMEETYKSDILNYDKVVNEQMECQRAQGVSWITCDDEDTASLIALLEKYVPASEYYWKKPDHVLNFRTEIKT